VTCYDPVVDERVRGWLAPRSDHEAAREDVAPWRSVAPERRVAEAAALSRMATAFLDRFEPEERRRLLAAQEPLAPEHEAIWRRLVRRGRGG
jgi:hypothetical protein